MDTRRKSNTEFRNEVSEILSHHESNFDQVHNTLQTILAELDTLPIHLNTELLLEVHNVNPFAPSSSNYASLTHTTQPTD